MKFAHAVGDRVRVTQAYGTSCADDKFVGVEGRVVGIWPNLPWPYSVRVGMGSPLYMTHDEIEPLKEETMQLSASQQLCVSPAKVVGKKTQLEMLEQHLRARGDISSVEAWNLYNVRSLSRRIVDLNNKGWEFGEQKKVAENNQRYVRYVVAKAPAI